MEHIFLSNSPDEIKIQQAEDLVSQNARHGQLSVEIPPSIHPEYQVILKLLEIETILKFSTSYERVEAKLKEVSDGWGSDYSGNPPVQDPELVTTYIRTKLSDVGTDYEFLVRNLDYKRFYELIRKKSLLINILPENFRYTSIAKNLDYKIVQLIIVASLDFRKYNTLKYFSQNFPSGLNLLTSQIFSLICENRIVPIYLLNDFLSQRSDEPQFGYYKLFTNLDHHKILENWMENNLMQLSKYYNTIKLSKIYEIFSLPEYTLDLEDLLVNMIAKNKLPLNTKIDQLKDLLVFGSETVVNSSLVATESKSANDDINQQIEELGQLLNEICSRI